MTEIGISGHLEELESFMIDFDDDASGTLEIDEFINMITEVVSKVSSVSDATGHDDYMTLKEAQLKMLCQFKWEDFAKMDDDCTGIKKELKKKIMSSKTMVQKSARKLDVGKSSRRQDTGMGGFMPRAGSGVGGPLRTDFLRRPSSKANGSPAAALPAAGQSAESSPLAALRGSPASGLAGARQSSMLMGGGVLAESEEELEPARLCFGLRLRGGATRAERVRWLKQVGNRLLHSGNIAIPVIRWDGATQAEEDAMDGVGFLFDSYKVQFWYWELVEMARKFIMSALPVFVYREAPTHQMAAVLCFATCFLVHFLCVLPYTNPDLNHVQALSLVAQTAALFYGLMLSLRGLERTSQEGTDTDAMQWGVLLLNVLMLMVPVGGMLAHDKFRLLCRSGVAWVTRRLCCACAGAPARGESERRSLAAEAEAGGAAETGERRGDEEVRGNGEKRGYGERRGSEERRGSGEKRSAGKRAGSRDSEEQVMKCRNGAGVSVSAQMVTVEADALPGEVTVHISGLQMEHDDDK